MFAVQFSHLLHFTQQLTARCSLRLAIAHRHQFHILASLINRHLVFHRHRFPRSVTFYLTEYDPLTRDAIPSIVLLCKRYTSIDCSEDGTLQMDHLGDVLGFLVDGREQNGEESYGSCSLSDSGG